MASATPSLDDGVRSALAGLEGYPGIRKLLAAVREMGIDTNSRAVRECAAKIRAEAAASAEAEAAEKPPPITKERYALQMPWIQLKPTYDSLIPSHVLAFKKDGTCRGLNWVRACWNGFEPRCLVQEQLPSPFSLPLGLTSSPVIEFRKGALILTTAPLVPDEGTAFHPYALYPPGEKQRLVPLNVLPSGAGLRCIASDAPAMPGMQSNDLMLANSKMNLVTLREAIGAEGGFSAACGAFLGCVAAEKDDANIAIEFDFPVEGAPRHAYGVATKPIGPFLPETKTLQPLLVAYGGPFWLDYVIADRTSTPLLRLRAIRIMLELYPGRMPPGPTAVPGALATKDGFGSWSASPDEFEALPGFPDFSSESDREKLEMGLAHVAELLEGGDIPAGEAEAFLRPYWPEKAPDEHEDGFKEASAVFASSETKEERKAAAIAFIKRTKSLY